MPHVCWLIAHRLELRRGLRGPREQCLRAAARRQDHEQALDRDAARVIREERVAARSRNSADLRARAPGAARAAAAAARADPDVDGPRPDG